MNVDPSRNVVAFKLSREGDDRVVLADVPARDEDGIEQAWQVVRREHAARPAEVLAIATEWEPSSQDAGFISRTFVSCTVEYNFARPADPEGWEAALAAAGETIRRTLAAQQLPPAPGPTGSTAGPAAEPGASERELIPVLCGPSSSRWQALQQLLAIPTHPLVPGKVFIALAMVGRTPHGTIGLDWLTEARLREFDGSFPDLLGFAFENVVRGMQAQGGPTELGGLLFVEREGDFGASVLALPTFYEQTCQFLGAERLVVGVPCAEELVVADADADAAVAFVHEAVSQCQHSQDGFLGATVLRMDPAGVQVLAERQI